MLGHTLVAASALSLTVAARATWYTGFESPQYTASPQGVILIGQQGWHIPGLEGSSFRVHAYAGNAPGFVQNPVGGHQFIAGVSSGPVLSPRSQVPVPFASGTWTVSYDMNAAFNGPPPAAPNLGSFALGHTSLATGAFQGFINLLNFNAPANPGAGWTSEFNVFNAAGTPMNNQSPGAFWADLKANNWYRSYVTVDFAAHQILAVTIVDLHTGLGASASPQGWYLSGGAASTFPLPDAVRVFTGGNAGNITGWDNIHAIPAPTAALALAAPLLVAARRRR